MAAEQYGSVESGMADVPEMSFERQWKIQNFDLICANDELLSSQSFKLQTTQGPGEKCAWGIGLKKTRLSCSEYIHMTFRLSEISGYDPPEVQTILTTGMIGVNGATLFARNVCDIAPNESHLFRLDETKDVFVCFTYNTNHPYQLSNAFFPNGSVIFFLKITLARHLTSLYMIPDQTKELEQLKTSSTTILLDNLAKLLGDEDSSDVKIITSDDVTLYAHKLVLKMQNPVFASMLTSDLSESRSGIVRVNDICGKTMEIILWYLYTGNLLPGWKDVDIISEFTYAAGKYQLTQVLQMLDNFLGSEHNDQYARQYVPLLSLANKLSLTSAEARLRQRIAEATTKAKTTEELFAIFSAQTETDATSYSANEGTSQKTVRW